MPPRTYTNPKPMTASAREAQRAFYCELCCKQYGRQNEYDDHIGSYAHSHAQNRQNLMELQNAMAKNTRKRKQTEEERAMRPLETPEPRKKPVVASGSTGRFLSIENTQGSARKEAKILGHNYHPPNIERGLNIPLTDKDNGDATNLENFANSSSVKASNFFPNTKNVYRPDEPTDLEKYKQRPATAFRKRILQIEAEAAQAQSSVLT